MYGNDNGGQRLISVIIVLIIAGFACLAFAKCGANISGATHDTAQKEADKWIRSMGLKAKADCAGVDSDGDGYVSCTLVVTDPSGATHIEPLECAGSFTVNSGCRAPKAVVRGAQ